MYETTVAIVAKRGGKESTGGSIVIKDKYLYIPHLFSTEAFKISNIRNYKIGLFELHVEANGGKFDFICNKSKAQEILNHMLAGD